MEIPSKEQIYALASKIKVMKPNVAKPDNTAQIQKVEDLLDSPDYVAEEKIDGCHYIMLSHMFLSKDHVDRTENFPHLVKGFAELGMPNLILDGEINYPGTTSQFATRVTGATGAKAITFQEEHGLIHYTIFDILRAPNGTWCNGMPYEKRRKLLVYIYNNYIANSKLAEYVHLTDMVEVNKRAFKDNILARGGEGVVLKKKNGLYVFGKKPMWEWMKIKQSDEADLFISGYKEPAMEYTGRAYDSWPYWMEIDGVRKPVTKAYQKGWVGALELSAYVDGKPQVICFAAGLDDKTLQEIHGREEEFLGKVVQIRFMEKTEEGKPRHPSFIAFHPDKEAEECTWEY